MDLTNLIPQIAAILGLSPSTLLAYVAITTTVANIGSRLIPADSTGALGVLRQICSIVGMHVSNRVASGVTEKDVAAASLDTPAVAKKVEAAADEKKS